jgi:molecular chaperone GrpE
MTEEEKQDELSALRRELSEKEEEIKSLRDRVLSLAAEFDNYRKQMGREVEALARRVQDQEILEFLPLYDSMERAFRTYRRNDDALAFVEGMERVFAQTAEILRRKGCQPLHSLGQRFDPAYHEVLVAVESAEERNVILEEFERGWLRDGRVLRPAKVKVSLGPKNGGEEHGKGESDRN